MKLTRQTVGHGVADGITGIAPIYKVSLDGKAALIGSGFWLTERGHIVTARHVIEDNIGANGVDEGPIYAMQTLGDGRLMPRVLRKTSMHPKYDLALSETLGHGGYESDPTWTFSMTLEMPKIGDVVGTYSFLSVEQKFDGEKYQGVTTHTFTGLLGIPEINITYELEYATRINKGRVLEIYPQGRDRVMIPFPCFCSDTPIYAANSGGPVFDSEGRVCGVNCTSYEGQDISFHMPLKGILNLSAPDIEFFPENPEPRSRYVFEMGFANRILFDPPLMHSVIPLWQRILFFPYYLYCDYRAKGWFWISFERG